MENNNQPPPSQPPETASSNPQKRNYLIEQMGNVSDFKNGRHLPFARIKKIMIADPDVRMVATEAPILFAKACEMFIVDLTMHSWLHAEEDKRHTLQRSDICDAVASSMTYDFLLDVVPTDRPHPADVLGMYAPQPEESSPEAAGENGGNSQPPPSPQPHNWIEQMEKQIQLARIKKIMEADPNVHMVADEAPVLFAKACEMFIADLTMRSWLHAKENKRHTLRKSDISDAVAISLDYDFLLDVCMPHPADVPGMYAPESAESSPEAAGEGEDEAGENGGNGGGN